MSGLGFYFAKDNKVENTHLFCVIWQNENCKLNRIFIVKIDRTWLEGGINFPSIINTFPGVSSAK